MEGFQLELVKKVVVIQLDGLRRIFSAVNDSRHLARTTQAAARTCALQYALVGADFDLHCFLQNVDHPRPDDSGYIKLVVRSYVDKSRFRKYICRCSCYSMNNELTESSLLILNIVSASRLATLN